MDENAQLARIEDLLRALVKATLSERLAKELADPKLRLLYSRTGQHTVSQLARATGFSAGKISGIWQRWETLGMVSKEGSRYRPVV